VANKPQKHKNTPACSRQGRSRKKRIMEPATLLQKIQHYCAFRERCTREVTDKLREWKVKPELIESTIARLKKEKFLDDERFAKAFARGKFRIKKWGRNRVVHELKTRNIPGELIIAGLSEIDEEEYLMVLKDLILKKKNEIKSGKSVNIRNKIINFVSSRGYEMQLILEAIHELKL
jgi:regulatory protein